MSKLRILKIERLNPLEYLYIHNGKITYVLNKKIERGLNNSIIVDDLCIEITNKELREENKKYSNLFLKLIEEDLSLFTIFDSNVYKIKDIKKEILIMRRHSKLHPTF